MVLATTKRRLKAIFGIFRVVDVPAKHILRRNPAHHTTLTNIPKIAFSRRFVEARTIILVKNHRFIWQFNNITSVIIATEYW